MKTARSNEISACPECGTRLAGGTCAACALGQLLSSGGASRPVFEEDGDEQVSKDFGRYTLKERIAAGGMGVVYLAEDTKLKRTVALKMIRGASFANESEIARFTIEAEAAAALDHPNIVPIYEIGRIDGQPFFTMRRIQGGNLAERLKRAGGSLAPAEAAELLRAVARAVQHAHHRGVLHRDLKPGNILIDGEGTPFLTDFGLAKLASADSDLTMTCDHLGTPDYMSPEVAAGKQAEVSTASDVWALGVILWEMLYGERPFRSAGTVETLRRIVEDEPFRPRGKSLDEDLTTLARRCLEKDPARRPESAGEVAEEIERWQRGEPIRARRISSRERFMKWVRRSKAMAALYGVLAVGVVVSFVLWHRAEKGVVELTQTNKHLETALSISTATKLSSEARLQVRDDPARALLLAVESLEHTQRHGGGMLPGAIEALYEVLQRAGGRDVSPLGPQISSADSGYLNLGIVDVVPVSFSPDGAGVVMVDYNDAAHRGVIAALFDARDEERAEPLARWRLWSDFTGIHFYTWLGDSRHLLSLGDDYELRLWDLGNRGGEGRGVEDAPPSRLLANLALEGMEPISSRFVRDQAGRGLSGYILYRNASPPEDTVAAGPHTLHDACFRRVFVDPDHAEPVRLGPLQDLPRGYAQETDVQLSGDGQWLALMPGERAGHAYLYDLRNPEGEAPRRLLSREKTSANLKFSPDSSRLLLIRRTLMLRSYDLTSGSLETIAASGRDLLQCTSSIRSLAFAPDGSALGIATLEPALTVVPLLGAAEEGPPVIRLSETEVLGLAFSPDGAWLAGGGKDRVLRAWPMAEFQKAPAPLEFRGVTSTIMDVEFSPTGDAIVATGMSCNYRHWKFDGVSDSAVPRSLPGQRETINDLACSPDHRWIATACGGGLEAGLNAARGSVKLTEVAGGREHLLGAHRPKATGVAFSPDGRWLASTGRDGLVRVWDLPAITQALAGERPLPGPRHVLDMTDTRPEYTRRLAFHPRGTLYATCGDGVLFEWNLNDPDSEIDAKRRHHRVHSIGYLLPDLRVSPDGRWLAVCRHGWDQEPREGFTQYGNMVFLFDVSQPGPPQLREELPGQFLELTNVDFSRDGRWLAAGGSGAGATVWDLEAPDIAASRRDSQVSAFILGALAFSPDNRWLGLGGSDGRLYLWDWRSDSRAQPIATTRPFLSLDWLENGHLVTGGLSGHLAIWPTDLEAMKRQARRVAGRVLSDQERARFEFP